MKSDVRFKEYVDSIINAHGENSVFKIFPEKDDIILGRVLKAEKKKITIQRYGGKEKKSISCGIIDAIAHVPHSEVVRIN